MATILDHPAGLEELPAPHDPDGELGVDRVLRNAEPDRDVTIREAVQLAERENLAAARRERVDRLDQQFDFLRMTGGFGGIGTIFYDAQPVPFRYIIEQNDPLPPEKIEGGIPRRLEEISPGFDNQAGVPGANQPQVGLLDQIVDVLHRGKMTVEEGAQFGLVGLNFLGEPAGLLWI
jgi:hypothetical protein